MLDRIVVRDFLKEELVERDISIPPDITEDKLVETFCQFTENDYYEWLKDNFKTFFEHGNVDWDWVRSRTNQNV